MKSRFAVLSLALLGCLSLAPSGHAEKTLKAVVHAPPLHGTGAP